MVLGVQSLIVASIAPFGGEEKRSRFSTGRFGTDPTASATLAMPLSDHGPHHPSMTAKILATVKGQGTSSRRGPVAVRSRRGRVA